MINRSETSRNLVELHYRDHYEWSILRVISLDLFDRTMIQEMLDKISAKIVRLAQSYSLRFIL